MQNLNLFNNNDDEYNRCVCCNEIIPEGRQVCYKCENQDISDSDKPSKKRFTEQVKISVNSFKKLLK